MEQKISVFFCGPKVSIVRRVQNSKVCPHYWPLFSKVQKNEERICVRAVLWKLSCLLPQSSMMGHKPHRVFYVCTVVLASCCTHFSLEFDLNFSFEILPAFNQNLKTQTDFAVCVIWNDLWRAIIPVFILGLSSAQMSGNRFAKSCNEQDPYVSLYVYNISALTLSLV